MGSACLAERDNLSRLRDAGRGEATSTSWAAVPAETPETVTGAPSAATEKAPAAGRLVWSTLSSKVTVIELPSAATAALVSSGGVVSGILMLTAVPAVQEKPGLNQVLVRAVSVDGVGEGEGGAADNDGEGVGGGR